jgi:hypothetical protein
MSFFRKALLATAMLVPSLAIAENTISQPISHVIYDGTADFLYVVGSGTWGAPSCASAYYVQVTAAVPGRKQLLAAVLAAHTAGRAVSFQGSCSSTAPNYFNATYITVQ